jgi:hypothetical protein
MIEHEHCTIKYPAIRDDKGSFYCCITQSVVAPYEYREKYGFDIVKEGKITHSGYHTPCKAMVIFPHLYTPAQQPISNPLSKENITISTVIGYEAGLIDGATQERERVLNILDENCMNARNCDKLPEVNFAHREMMEWIQSLRKGTP